MYEPVQKLALSAFELIGLLVFGARNAAEASLQTNARPVVQEAASKVEAPPRSAFELLEPPKRKGKKTRYWIASHLRATDILGFAFPGQKQWKFLQDESSGPDNETIRHFRLPDGRHVLAMYDQLYFYSLLLIYKPPPEKERIKKQAQVSTENGSLEVWLLRHEGQDYGEHYLPLEPWKRFLSSSSEDRARQAKTFRLEGSLKVREDQFGLVQEMMDIDLRSLKPLPPFKEYLEYKEKEAKEVFDWQVKAVGARIDEVKKRYEATLEELTFRRKHKATEPAKIEGWLHAGWVGPPWKVISP